MVRKQQRLVVPDLRKIPSRIKSFFLEKVTLTLWIHDMNFKNSHWRCLETYIFVKTAILQRSDCCQNLWKISLKAVGSSPTVPEQFLQKSFRVYLFTFGLSFFGIWLGAWFCSFIFVWFCEIQTWWNACIIFTEELTISSIPCYSL